MKRVSAVVVGYGESPLLGRCVEALLASEGVDVELIVVDNGVADGSVAALLPDPRLRCVAAPRNLGFGGGCNLGASVATGAVVAFVNPDAIVAADALAKLAEALEDPTIGIVTAQIRLLREPGLINSAGNAIHFLGLGWAIGYRQPAELWMKRRDVAAASGAGMAMRADVFYALGGFTEELFLYHEDAELSWRTWMAGWRVVYVPEARIAHDYEFSRHPQKLYYLERNRVILLLTCYQLRTLGILAPLLVAFEAGMWSLAVVQGWGRAQARAWVWIVRHRAWIHTQRRRLQQARTRRDREVADLLSGRFDATQQSMPVVAQPVADLLGLLWRVARQIL